MQFEVSFCLVFNYIISGGLRDSSNLRDSVGGGVAKRSAGGFSVTYGMLHCCHSGDRYIGAWVDLCKSNKALVFRPNW